MQEQEVIPASTSEPARSDSEVTKVPDRTISITDRKEGQTIYIEGIGWF